MRLIFLRHGIAEARRADVDEEERALTKEGIRKTRAVLRGLAALDPAIDVCWTSPFRRARETAELALERFDVPIETRPQLLPDATWPALKKALAKAPKTATLLLVGHEPSMSQLVAASIGAPEGAIALKKAGIAWVELERLDRPGTLHLLLTPRVAAAGRKR